MMIYKVESFIDAIDDHCEIEITPIPGEEDHIFIEINDLTEKFERNVITLNKKDIPELIKCLKLAIQDLNGQE